MNTPVNQQSSIVPTSSNTIMRRINTASSYCQICGVFAQYSYYGAIVCQSCKMFFKRNAEHGQGVLKCRFDDECKINMNNRHICSSCRLAKCFANGMSIELFRSSRTHKNEQGQKRKLIPDSVCITSTVLMIPKKKYPTEHIPTSNLLQSDRLSLSIEQWNLLSNLVHCFDEHSDYSFVKHFINEQNSLPLKLRFKYPLVSDFFTSVMIKVQFVFEKTRDLLSLSSHDRTILLRSTVEYTASIGGMFMLHQARLLDNVTFLKSAEMIFQQSAMSSVKRVIDLFGSDDIFIKLTLGILAFSTTNYTIYNRNVQNNLTNIKVILPVQDMYTELVWRYLLHKYDHHQAVIRFSNLIRCLLSINDAIVEAHESKQFREMIDSVVRQTEQKLCL